MKKHLALMHNTSGKTNRIKLRVAELIEELGVADVQFPDKIYWKDMNKEQKLLSALQDIKNTADNLDGVLDKFYSDNKHLGG